MRRPQFLENIAKTFEPRVYGVFCRSLQGDLIGQAVGLPAGKFTIYIDRERIFCCVLVRFVFFHELAHIVLGHLGESETKSPPCLGQRETEANRWAFEMMGFTGRGGNEACYNCILSFMKFGDHPVFRARDCPKEVAIGKPLQILRAAGQK